MIVSAAYGRGLAACPRRRDARRALAFASTGIGRSSSVVADLVRHVGGWPDFHELRAPRASRRLNRLTLSPILSAGPFLRVPGALSSGDLTPGGVAGPGGGEAGGAGDAGPFDWTSEPPDFVVPAIKSPSSRAWRV